MVTLFRKLLIRLGKTIPFVLAFILLVGYVETIHSIITNNTIEIWTIYLKRHFIKKIYKCPINTNECSTSLIVREM